MALTVRCPACSTQFKLVPDQLKVSDGWVRCGQCSEVFDAHHDPALRALGLSDTAPDPLTHQPSPSAVRTEPTHEAIGREAVGDAEPSDRGAAVRGGPAHDDFDWVTTVPVHFMKDADPHRLARQRRWRRRTGVAVLLLAALLAGQVAVDQPDRVATLWPAWPAALATVCRHAGCALPPLRHIESVVIDSSSFTQVRTDIYRLQALLRNQSALPLAMPALEVTLTDHLDRPVFRRVLVASEFSPGQDALAPNSELSAQVVLGLVPDPRERSAASVAGYRVLAFYP